MLHPIMPFVTEELWEHFRKDKGLLSNSNWPTISVNSIDKNQSDKIENVISFIEDVRSTKSDFNLLSVEKQIYSLLIWKPNNIVISRRMKKLFAS